jgi:hypothetical protein
MTVLYKNNTFLRNVDMRFSRSFQLIAVLFYELHFLQNYVTYQE